MDFKEILELICLILCGIGFICIVIFSIIDIIKSNKYWKKMEANLDLMDVALKKEHDLLKKTQEFGEWLDTFHALMYSNSKFEDTEFNKGTLTAAADIEGKFLEIMGEYVDGKESSD